MEPESERGMVPFSTVASEWAVAGEVNSFCGVNQIEEDSPISRVFNCRGKGDRGTSYVVKQVAEFVSLGFQVLFVLVVRRHLDGHALINAHPIADQADYFRGVVGQQADSPYPEVM